VARRNVRLALRPSGVYMGLPQPLDFRFGDLRHGPQVLGPLRVTEAGALQVNEPHDRGTEDDERHEHLDEGKATAPTVGHRMLTLPPTVSSTVRVVRPSVMTMSPPIEGEPLHARPWPEGSHTTAPLQVDAASSTMSPRYSIGSRGSRTVEPVHVTVTLVSVGCSRVSNLSASASYTTATGNAPRTPCKSCSSWPLCCCW